MKTVCVIAVLLSLALTAQPAAPAPAGPQPPASAQEQAARLRQRVEVLRGALKAAGAIADPNFKVDCQNTQNQSVPLSDPGITRCNLSGYAGQRLEYTYDRKPGMKGFNATAWVPEQDAEKNRVAREKFLTEKLQSDREFAKLNEFVKLGPEAWLHVSRSHKTFHQKSPGFAFARVSGEVFVCDIKVSIGGEVMGPAPAADSNQLDAQARALATQLHGEIKAKLQGVARAAGGACETEDALARAVRVARRFHAKGVPRLARGLVVVGSEAVGPEAEYVDVMTRIARASKDEPPGSAAALRNHLLRALHSSQHSTIPSWYERNPLPFGAQPGEDVYTILTHSIAPRFIANNLEARCGANDKLVRYVRAKDRRRQVEWQRFVRSVEFLRDLVLFAVDLGLGAAGIPNPMQVVAGLQWFQNIQNPDPRVRASLAMQKETAAVMYDAVANLPGIPEVIPLVASVIKYSLDQSLKAPPSDPFPLASDLTRAIDGAQTEGAWHDRHDVGRQLIALGRVQLAAAITAIDQNLRAGRYGPVQLYMGQPWPQDPWGRQAQATMSALTNDLRSVIWQEVAIGYWGGWMDPTQSPAQGRVTCG